MASLSDIRATHPEYNDMTDQQLADGIYKKFYSDMPRDQFDAKIGLNPAGVGHAPHVGMGHDVSVGDNAIDPGAVDAAALHLTNQALGGFGPQAAGAIQGILDATGLDQHRGGVDRAAPGAPQPRTVAELAAATKPAYPSIGSFSGGYNNTVDEANANLASTAVQHPNASLAGGVGGAAMLAGMIPARALAGVLGVAGKAGTIAARVGEGFAGGLGYGAVAGAGNAGGDVANRLKGGLEEMAVMGPLGAVVPAITAGIAAGGRAGGRAIAYPFRQMAGNSDPTAEAARRFTGGLSRDTGGDPYKAVKAMEDAQAAGHPMIAADTGEVSRAVADSAAVASPEGRAILHKALDDRAAGKVERVTGAIEQAAPGINAPEIRAALQDAAVKENAKAYAIPYSQGAAGVWSPKLEQMTSMSPTLVDAMRKAAVTGKDRAALEGFGAFNPGVTVTEDGRLISGGKGGPTRPTLQFWDYTKRELDDIATRMARAGDNNKAGVARDLAKQLRAELDLRIPSYAKARGTAAAFFGADSALEQGANFVKNAKPEDFYKAQKELAKMSPVNRQLFSEGYATELVGRLRNNPNLINGNFLKSPAARDRIELALGKGGADRIEATLRFEAVADLTRHSIKGQSKTAQRLVELGLAGGVGTYQGGGNPFSQEGLISAALTYGMLRVGRAALSAGDTAIAREVARLAASDDPQLVKQAIDRVSQSPGLMRALRAGQTYLTRIIAPSAARVGQRMPRLLPNLASGPIPAEADQNQQ